MDDDDLEFDSDEPISRRMTGLDLVLHFITWLTGLLAVTTAVANNVSQELTAHYNWRFDQRAFAEETRQNIEMITEGSDAKRRLSQAD